MELDRIIEELKKERERLSRAINVLVEGGPSASRKTKAAAVMAPRVGRERRGGITPEGRKRLSVLMKRRWEERRRKTKKNGRDWGGPRMKRD